jgi:(Z)-2-((N-methylformamido)methylene)-5-hydroxybutyrolactone dehydrogenase
MTRSPRPGADRRFNDSLYGLASGVWTTSMKRAFTASSRLRTGSVWINTYRAVSFLAPFGGFKRSGIGRENGQHAIDEYLETKTVWMSFSDETPNPFVMR